MNQVDKYLEFPVCALKIINFLVQERVIDNDCFFDPEVSIQDLVEKVGLLIRGICQFVVFSFVDRLDLKNA